MLKSINDFTIKPRDVAMSGWVVAIPLLLIAKSAASLMDNICYISDYKNTAPFVKIKRRGILFL